MSVAVLFLVAMTLLRVGTYFAFMRGRFPLSRIWAALWLGFRFDGRIVASAMLPLLVLGSMPLLDAFRSTFARRFSLTLLGLFTGGLLVFYACDYLHYQYLHQRLNASVLGFFGDASISGRMIWETYPVVRIVLCILAAAAGLQWTFVRLHRRAATPAVTLRRPARVAWFVTALLACLVGIFGRIGQYPLRWSDAFNLRNDVLANLALNPVQSFISSLDFRTSGFEAAKVRQHYGRRPERVRF